MLVPITYMISFFCGSLIGIIIMLFMIGIKTNNLYNEYYIKGFEEGYHRKELEIEGSL